MNGARIAATIPSTNKPTAATSTFVSSSSSEYKSTQRYYSTFGEEPIEVLVKGKRVTGFTNGEEADANLTHVVPFLVEDELKKVGGLYEKAADWTPFALVDGRVVTGQNPASSTPAAKALVELLAARKAA